MSTWFYFPGAVMTSWLKWLLGGGTVDGLENVPREGAYIMVSNHTSNLDPPFIGAAIGRHTGRPIFFMAKEEKISKVSGSELSTTFLAAMGPHSGLDATRCLKR